MSDGYDQELSEVVGTLLERAWIKHQRGDALGAHKLALQAYRLQPQIEDNPNIRPYLDEMLVGYDEREQVTLNLSWRDTGINLAKIGVALTFIYAVFSIVLYPIITPIYMQFSQQLFQSITRELPPEARPNFIDQQMNLPASTIIINLITNAITSAVTTCIALLVRNGIYDVVATRVLKGHGTIHRFIHKTVRYEILTFAIASVLGVILSYVMLNTIFVPLFAGMNSSMPPQPTNVSLGAPIVAIVVLFLGGFVVQGVWLARIIGKSYQFSTAKGCLTQVIPVAVLFGTFFCLCGVVPMVLAGIAGR